MHEFSLTKSIILE